MKKILSESIGDMTKDELRKFVKELIQDELDKKFSKDKEEEVKKIVKTLMRKYYYNIWQKSPFFIDNL